MTHTATRNTTLTQELGGFSGQMARLRQRWADYREYRRTLAELDMLTDRDLADLGLSRLDIKEVAYESVYGN